VDALALHAQIRAVRAAGSADCLVDLGSGAGFPGLPIAIMEPTTRVVLVDSRERRYHFQRTVRRGLGLQNVEPLLGRIEELECIPGDIVVAQALAQPDAAVQLGLGWVRAGGLLVVPGTAAPPHVLPRAEIVRSGTRRYHTPVGRSRSIWWGEKAGEEPLSA
jgi:16S rRNA (guanine527-N7)-methyltransferase